MEVLLLVLEQRLGRLGHEHLATVRGGLDASGAMDGKARIPAVDGRGLAGVDPDPDFYRGGVRPGVAGERTLRFHRAQHGLVRASKRVEESIALGVDLVAAVGGEGLPQEPLVLGQNLRPAPTQLPDELRRALDVGEQEGDGARRKLAHALIIRQRDAGFKLRRAPRFAACCPLRCPHELQRPCRSGAKIVVSRAFLMGREGFEPRPWD